MPDFYDKLGDHVKLCKKNLLSNRVKCCANCPFEDQICVIYPELAELFEVKRRFLKAKQDAESI